MGYLRLPEQVREHARVWEMGYSPKTVLEALGGMARGCRTDSWFLWKKVKIEIKMEIEMRRKLVPRGINKMTTSAYRKTTARTTV